MCEHIAEQDIAQMRRNGYCTSTIARAETTAAHQRRGLDLIPQIEAAFRGVELGAGTGLSEARGIDDYCTPDILKQLREADEKVSWARIPAERLNGLSDTFCFMNEEGVRFHLPAVMIAHLRGQIDNGWADTIAYAARHDATALRSLSADQRQVVRAYIGHVLACPAEGRDDDSAQ